MNAPGRVVVIGGGIAGLSCAHALLGRAEVTVIEMDTTTGGKCGSEEFRGVTVDRGPDAFITRDPTAVELCRAVGLGDDVITPGTSSAAIWSSGRLRPFPRGLAIGIPTDLGALRRASVISRRGVVRARLEGIVPGRISPHLVEDAHSGRADPTVGALVRRRLGRAVVDGLVDPLVGGINAGNVDELSFVAALPQLAPRIAGARRITRALAPQSPPPGPAAPIFGGLLRGMGSLTTALDEAVEGGGGTILRGTRATGLGRDAAGVWRVATAGAVSSEGTSGPVGPTGPIDADAVVLAVPAAAAARLLRPLSPTCADELDAIPYASVATVTLAWPSDAVPPSTTATLRTIVRGAPAGEGPPEVLPGSGLLVPRTSGHAVTAVTFVSSKWPRSSPPGEVIVRASLGRSGDERAVAHDDAAITAAVRAEIAELLGITAPPLEVRVVRWPDAFPQYRPGHLARVARITALLGEIGGIARAGAAYDGIGIPACIRSGTAAAEVVLAGR